MARNMKQIEQRLNSLDNEKAKLEAQKKAKKQAQRNKDRKIARRERNHRIFTVGGLIEKMGLDKLEETELLGLLYRARYFYERVDTEKLEGLKAMGEKYREQGKRLDPLESK